LPHELLLQKILYALPGLPKPFGSFACNKPAYGGFYRFIFRKAVVYTGGKYVCGSYLKLL
jgi:hypothetical protein